MNDQLKRTEGSNLGSVWVLFQHLPGETEEYEEQLRISGILAEVPT
jgi:hypothetical protein